MLILTRKPSESIILDGGIKITVAGIQGNQVRIGIEAAKEVKVYREEIFKRMSAYSAPPYG